MRGAHPRGKSDTHDVANSELRSSEKGTGYVIDTKVEVDIRDELLLLML